MNVCVDAADRIVAGLAPGDAGCTRQRDIKNNEAPPYRNHTYRAVGDSCASNVGSIGRVHIPVSINGATRNVSYTDRGHSVCDPSLQDYKFGRVDAFSGSAEGFSIQYFDSEFGFTMGSWSPVSNSYWITTECEADSVSSRRMFRGWVIAPSQLSKLPIGGLGTTIVGTYIQNPELEPGRLIPKRHCPTTYNYAYTSYFRNYFTFGRRDGVGAKRLDTIISNHFPKSGGAGPGTSENYERTYWTDQLGLSRWEKWATNKYSRNGESAAQISRTLRAQGACSKPYDMPVSVNSRDHTSALVDNDLIYEDHVDPATGIRKRFYMVYCNDYTNIVRQPNPNFRLEIKARANPIFWE